MGHVSILFLDEMRLDKMGLDEMGWHLDVCVEHYS